MYITKFPLKKFLKVVGSIGNIRTFVAENNTKQQ